MAISVRGLAGSPFSSSVFIENRIRYSQWRATVSSVPRRSRFHSRVYADAKMYVPGDSFGGRSPEVYFADRMKAFFTFIAVK
jgi:hypothetical protein